VALPWYVAVILRDHTALDTFLAFARGENVGHLRDPFYYLGVYPLYGLPAVLAVLPALRLPWTATLDAEARRRIRLPFAAMVLTFVLQSALHAKQTHYLIPTVYPMGCVLGGVWLDGLLARARGPRTPTALRLTGLAIVVAELVAVGWVVPAQNDAQGARAFFERAGRRLPDGARVGWTVFASHSDYLWYLPAHVVGTTGLPELVAGDPAATIARVRTFLTTDGEGYAIVRATEAEALTDVAEILERDDTVGKKRRDLALVRTRAGSGDRR
jgi:4-amino-4-deoxy-L-arabinose transferase-like glycosyltransferase